MLNSIDFSGRPFHFIGIGGIGMSALAHILVRWQLPVSGSDVRLNHITQRLQDAGAHIFWSQDASNLKFFQSKSIAAWPEPHAAEQQANVPPSVRQDESAGRTATATTSVVEAPKAEAAVLQLPQIICSTAISTQNPEYRAAVELGCPIFHRSDLLAALIRHYHSIAVAGTHGKTTTSSIIGYLLFQAQLDPTIVIGGEVEAWEGNARLGDGEHLVAEADESDGSLVKLSAAIGVVTNIELDHPDHYHSLDDVIGTFKTFRENCQTLVGCVDCDNVRSHIPLDISYSLSPEAKADYTADNVQYEADGTIARIWERGQILGSLKLKLLGRHNLSNALAVIAVGRHLGIDFPTINQALSTFQGARRRFECRGIHHNITFIDDYAHHPSEIKATLAAARQQVQATIPPSSNTVADTAEQRRIIAVFQPHRYSRTRALLDEFASAFTDADSVVLTDIYSAGEVNTTHITGEHLAEKVAEHHAQVAYHAPLEGVYQCLTEILRPGDVVLFLGAGNLNQMIPDVMEYYAGLDAQSV
ncbi:MAG: UDP-N-acetylmuramate--L-alanine ligase [Thainema sp.]